MTQKTYFHVHQIIDHVQAEFGICYTVAGMNKWLHHNKFSYKKPKGVPHKFDAAKQRTFVEAYEALKASGGADESILFMGAAHPTQATRISHGWIRTGHKHDKTIETTGSRTRINDNFQLLPQASSG